MLTVAQSNSFQVSIIQVNCCGSGSRNASSYTTSLSWTEFSMKDLTSSKHHLAWMLVCALLVILTVALPGYSHCRQVVALSKFGAQRIPVQKRTINQNKLTITKKSSESLSSSDRFKAYTTFLLNWWKCLPLPAFSVYKHFSQGFGLKMSLWVEFNTATKFCRVCSISPGMRSPLHNEQRIKIENSIISRLTAVAEVGGAVLLRACGKKN